MGKLHEGLYIIENLYKAVDSSQIQLFINGVVYATPDIWHTRLGHSSISQLSGLKDVLSFDSSMLNKNHLCEICPLAKQKRLSFESHNNRTINFDMIHADVWGPFSTHSLVGYKYFLTIRLIGLRLSIKKHSRYTWVFLMKNKSGILKIVPQFFAYVETQYNKTINVFRSDNALELSFTKFVL